MRTNGILSMLEKEASKNKVTLNQLFGVLLKQANYKSKDRKRICNFADSLIFEAERKSQIQTREASYIQQ